jgi:hypothetical protein
MSKVNCLARRFTRSGAGVSTRRYRTTVDELPAESGHRRVVFAEQGLAKSETQVDSAIWLDA